MKIGRRHFLALASALPLARCGGSGNRLRAHMMAWGGPGRRNGSFLKPRAVGVDKGEVFIVDATGRVQVFTEDGEYLRQWNVPSSDNGTPTCVAFDKQHQVFLPDTHYHRILRYTREGELLEDWGAYGSGGDEFVYPTGVVEGADGTLYISEYGEEAERLHLFAAASEPDGERKFLTQWGTFGEEAGQFNRPMAIDMGLDGSLYVADTGNNRVQRFAPDGTPLGVIGELGCAPGQLKDPFDLAVAPDGSVFVCEYGNHRISRFTADGEFMSLLGEPGRDLGHFYEPRGIAVSSIPSGQGKSDPDAYRLFVADTGNHRIQRIDKEVFG